MRDKGPPTRSLCFQPTQAANQLQPELCGRLSSPEQIYFPCLVGYLLENGVKCVSPAAVGRVGMWEGRQIFDAGKNVWRHPQGDRQRSRGRRLGVCAFDASVWLTRPLVLFFHLQYGEEEVCSDRLDTDFPDIDLSQLDTSDFDSVNCLSELQWCNDQPVDASPASIRYSTADELFEVRPGRERRHDGRSSRFQK